MYDSWKKSRNYRRVIDESGNVTPVITVDGVDVTVTEEVYVAYAQMDRRERYEAERDFGKLVSLDEMLERHIPVESLYGYCDPDFEDEALERDEKERMLRCLAFALEALNEKERLLIRALYYEDVSVREYAKRLEKRLWTAQCRRDKALKKLKGEILKILPKN